MKGFDVRAVGSLPEHRSDDPRISGVYCRSALSKRLKGLADAIAIEEISKAKDSVVLISTSSRDSIIIIPEAWILV